MNTNPGIFLATRGRNSPRCRKAPSYDVASFRVPRPRPFKAQQAKNTVPPYKRRQEYVQTQPVLFSRDPLFTSAWLVASTRDIKSFVLCGRDNEVNLGVSAGTSEVVFEVCGSVLGGLLPVVFFLGRAWRERIGAWDGSTPSRR